MFSKNCTANLCPNPRAIKFDVNFNCQQDTAAPLKIIIEMIPGVEDVHFGNSKYDFLITIGAMFDKAEIIKNVLSKVEDFVNDNKLIQ